MNIFVLEDSGSRVNFFIERFSRHSLKIVENSKMAIEYLKKYKFDYLFLDNDLGTGNGEGKDVAKFLLNNPSNPNNNAVIIIHSWNRSAAENIKSMLPFAELAPFNTEDFFNLNLDI